MKTPPSLPPQHQQDHLPPPPQQQQQLEDNLGMRMLLPVGRSGWAIAAGYLGLFALVVFPAPLALIVSIIAIWDIRRSKHSGKPKYGMGRAIFGLIAGIIGTVVLAMLIVPRFLSN